MNRRLTDEELAEISERVEKANDGNPLINPQTISDMYDSVDDVPKLLAEIERLKSPLRHFADSPNEYDSPEQIAEVAKAYLNGTEDEDR